MASDGDKQSMGDLFRQRRAHAAAAAQQSGAGGASSNLSSLGRASSSIPASGFGGPPQADSAMASGGRKSFAEIQKEQAEMERASQRQPGHQFQQQSVQQGQFRQGHQRGRQSQQQQRGAVYGDGHSGGAYGEHAVDEYGRLARPSGGGGGGRGIGTRDLDYDRDPYGGGGGGRGGGNARQRGGNSRGGQRGGNRNSRDTLPVERGEIHTLLDKFGFLRCADRDRDLFFHYSEFRGGEGVRSTDELSIGDEVEFRVGPAEERGGRRGGGGEGGGGGKEGEEKLSAFDVRLLPKGSVVWESEDEPVGSRRRGRVERAAREDRGRSGPGGGGGGAEGFIRVIAADGSEDDDAHKGAKEVDGDSGNDKKGKDGTDELSLEVHYKTVDYASESAPRGSGSGSNLGRGDIVEFTLVTERRTSRKFARNISLVRCERDRLREERERRLLEGATLEKGRVASLKGDYGFLRSAMRSEEVYFHMSNVMLPEDDEEGGIGGTNNSDEGNAKKKTIQDARMTRLKEGQDVQFYVIDESHGGGSGRSSSKSQKGGKSLNARKIELLPLGSVEFEHVVATGVTGTVLECPLASNASEPFGGSAGTSRRGGGDRRSNRAGNDDKVGRVRLHAPIAIDGAVIDSTENIGGATATEVVEVTLHQSAYPGGTFAINRLGSEIGCWIRPGDVLLFDVVKTVMDGSCRAVPTTAMTRSELCKTNTAAEEPSGNGNEGAAKSTLKSKPAVRLIEPSLLCCRSEGVVRSVHDNYGFISLAERNLDIYFPLFEVMPGEMQGDLVRNDTHFGSRNDVSAQREDVAVPTKGGRVNVEVGMEVAFDLLLTAAGEGGAGRYNNRQGRNGSAPQEKENLRARRVQVLPKGTVRDKIYVASSVKARVIKEDPKNLLGGTLEFEETLKVDISLKRRHPLVAQLIENVKGGKYACMNENEEAILQEVLSEQDERLLITMINAGAEEDADLTWRYVADDDRRLCISRRTKNDAVEENPVDIFPPASSLDGAPSTEEGGNESAVDADAATSSGGKKSITNPRKKSKRSNVRTIRTLKFDKFSFSPGDSGDDHDVTSITPLVVGDVITCNVYQNRRSGAILIDNIIIVERKGRPEVSEGDDGSTSGDTRKKTTGLTGFVTEVVSTRQFGFITAVDGESGERTGEHLFFHFKELVVESIDTGNDGQDRGAKSKKILTAAIRKGDEVKFDLAKPGKNGKLTAGNVTILPRGTLKAPVSKVDTSQLCTGYILIEPSHTSLANTPSHIVAQSSSGLSAASGGGGRWDNVRDESAANQKSGSKVAEGGVILLLSDPMHLFTQKPKVEAETPKIPGQDAVGETTDNSPAAAAAESNAGDGGADASEMEESNASESSSPPQVFVNGIHLIYKQSSVMRSGFSSNIGDFGRNGADGPKRGDLVTFGKTRGAKLVKDIRIEKANSATSVTGILTKIDIEAGTAVFVVSSDLPESSGEDQSKKYNIQLTEVVSCDKSFLKDQEPVEGILHESMIYGVCRTKDIHLASSFGRKAGASGSIGGASRERPKLNLTVKKELQGMGGQIMAQSRMAKGPDGTNGFVPGWTTRLSTYVQEEETVEDATDLETKEELLVEGNITLLKRDSSLSVEASEFVPAFAIPSPSGFELEEGR